MNKVYTRINWENYPSENTALNESNLNKMDSALNEIDTRVVEHDTTKANVALLNNLIDDWHIDETTGVITIHKVSGEQIIFDLNIEKVPVGFSMTDDGILIMTTDDGTEFTANIGSMIPVLTFNDSDQIAVAVSGEGVNKTYTFTIKTGSITADKLQPNFLADVTLQAGNAEISARAANQYAQKAKEYADEAKGSAELANTDGIVSIMNQATTTWVMPDYMQDRDTQPYVCGIGTPEENGYSADDYNDENGYGEPYLDVRSGMVYEAIRINDAPLTYGWVEKEQLKSVQEGLNKTSWSAWENVPITTQINNGEIKYRENDYFYELSINVNVASVTAWTTQTIATLPFNINTEPFFNKMWGGAYAYVPGYSRIYNNVVDIVTASTVEGVAVNGHFIIPKYA